MNARRLRKREVDAQFAAVTGFHPAPPPVWSRIAGAVIGALIVAIGVSLLAWATVAIVVGIANTLGV